MQNTDMRVYNGDDFKREVDEFFADNKKKRKSTGVRQKRKGRNLGGAKAVKR